MVYLYVTFHILNVTGILKPNPDIMTYRFIFTFLLISVFVYSQDNIKKYETDRYFISYPEQYILKPNTDNSIIGTSFFINWFNSATGYNEPIIQLTIVDYSKTGIGPWSSIEKQEKDKIVTKLKTKFNKTDFDRINYVEDNFEIIQYIFLKNNVIYILKGFLQKDYKPEFKLQLENIMESFDLN